MLLLLSVFKGTGGSVVVLLERSGVCSVARHAVPTETAGEL
jgi:hypothetical protein